MSSTAIATFNVKNLRAGIPPGDTDVAVASVLKKKFDDTTLWFSFTDATLKDPSRGQGILLGAERKLSGMSTSDLIINRNNASLLSLFLCLIITPRGCRWRQGCLGLRPPQALCHRLRRRRQVL